MKSNGRLLALSLVALVAASDFVMSQSASEQDLQAVEADLAVSKQRQLELEAQAKQAVVAEEQLSNRLVALAETTAEQERKSAIATRRESKLKAEIAAINLDLANKQDVIAEVLAGLQRLEHNPPPALVVAPDDVLQALRGAMVFGTIVPELRRSAKVLHDQLSTLKNLREKLVSEVSELAEAQTALAKSRSEIAQLIAEKQTLAKTSAAQLLQEQQRTEALVAQATSLKELLAKLAEEKATAEARQSAEEKAHAEAKRKLEDQQVLPKIAFSKAQGQVNFPVQGQLIRQFGTENGVGGTLDGIVISTLTRAQVTSPVSGKVEFAGKFRSYGHMVIIDPGENYLVLLAGLDQTLARFGQSVKAGEPIGQMGEKPGALGLLNGLTNLTTPVLYVEFRKNGNPVDPAPWWVGTTQEAMR